MSNVIQFNKSNLRGENYEVSPEYHGGDTNIFFPVREDIIQVGDSDTSRFKAIVREDTNVTLAIHTQDYKLIKNEDVFTPLHDAITKSKLDLTGMKIKDQVGEGGRRVMRKYTFPAHTVEIGRGDPVELEVRALNSYDGSWAFKQLVGGFRLVCSNGMVVGETMLKIYGRHTSGLNPKFSADKVEGALGVYLEQTEVWKKWTGKKLTDNRAKLIIEKMGQKPSPKLQEEIFRLYQMEKETLGNTIWALFNAMTYWSTHNKLRKGADPITIVQQREDRVRKALKSQAFLKIAA